MIELKFVEKNVAFGIEHRLLDRLNQTWIHSRIYAARKYGR